MMGKAEIGTEIARAAEWLRAGELVAIPTETVYGLAGNGLSETAIAKIYAAKGRPSHNPLILHIAGADRVWDLAAEFPKDAQRLAEAFWPGPLTLVLPRKPHIPDAATGGLETVGLRVPAHPLTRKLLAQLDFPLAAPSANLSNRISPVTAQHVFDQLGDRIPYILDGGRCEKGIESTIVSFAGNNPQILRLGSVGEEALRSIVPNIEGLKSGNIILAPGMMRKHYSPLTPLQVVDKHHWREALVPGKRMGLICLKAADLDLQGLAAVYELSPSGNLEEAAHHLYAALHEMDAQSLDLILAIPLPSEGLGASLNDRIQRASIR